MDESGFRFGLVVRNTGVPDYVVMVLCRLADWVYQVDPSITHPQAMAVVMHSTRYHENEVGGIVKISGSISRDGWEVVG